MNKHLANVISITIALLSIALCLFIWGQLSGFEKGYFYGVLLPLDSTGFATSGPNYFQTINGWYFIITASFCIFAIVKLLITSPVAGKVCILSLCVGIYPYWDMFSYKKEILSMTTKFSYDYWLSNSIYFDWFLLFAAIVLILIEISFLAFKKADTKIFQIT